MEVECIEETHDDQGMVNEQTNKQTDEQTDEQTDKQTDEQTDEQQNISMEHPKIFAVGLEQEEEIVTCHFVADDWIDEVYYNDVDVRCDIENANKPATLKVLKFTPKDGGVLAIATNDNEPGTSAVFCFKCSSTNPKSYWNFELDANNVKLYEVLSYGIAGSWEQHGPMKRPPDKQPNKDWYKNDFDDNSWMYPTESTNDFLAKSMDMSGVWCKEFKYCFFRFNPQKVNLAELEKKRQQEEDLRDEIRSMVKQAGYNILDMKYQMSFDDVLDAKNKRDEDIGREIVTCQFVAEGKIISVHYGNEDKRSEVTNVNSDLELVKTFIFSPKNNEVLAIGAHAKAFGFQCSSTHPDSYWNFTLDSDNCRLFEVRSSGRIRKDSDYSNGSMEWYMKDFDDSSWEYPTQPPNDFLTKFHHMSRIWYKDSKYAYFRFNPQKVDLERLAMDRKERAILSDKVSNLARRYGFNVQSLKFQKDEDPVVESEAGYPPIKEDQPINRKILNYVADHIASDWKCLSRHLALDESKIDQIEVDNCSTYERAVKCQHAWIRMSRSISWSNLKTALLQVPRNDIVRDVEEKFGNLIIEDFESSGMQTLFTKRKIDIDTSTRLDQCEDANRFPKIYPGTLHKGNGSIPVAAKTFIIENEEHRRKLKENANLMYDLRKTSKCPHIVNLIDIYEEEEGKQFILILERCDFDMKMFLGFSQSLLSKQQQELITWTQQNISMETIARDVLNGLEYVHSNHHGVTFMHRDIKPSNILFKITEKLSGGDRQIIVKISDFGISKQTVFSRIVTTTCLNKGTDLYMPNDIREKANCKRQAIEVTDLKMADMFAFGVTLHQMLRKGKHPFEGKTDTRTSCNIEEGTRTELFHLKDKTALNLIYNLTEPDPRDRLTAAEVKNQHPWFYDHKRIIELLKETYTALCSPKVNASSIKVFEEASYFANDGDDWKKKLPESFSDKLKLFNSNTDQSGPLNTTIRDQIKFILTTVGCIDESLNATFLKHMFGKNQVSDEEIIDSLLKGEGALFPSFLIHVFCKTSQVFPHLKFASCEGVKKIVESYNRYIEEVKERNPDIYSNNEDKVIHELNGKNNDVGWKNKMANRFGSIFKNR